MTEDTTTLDDYKPADYVKTLNFLMKQANKDKTDDGASSDDRRRWAIVYTDLEKLKAYIQTYLEVE